MQQSTFNCWYLKHLLGKKKNPEASKDLKGVENKNKNKNKTKKRVFYFYM